MALPGTSLSDCTKMGRAISSKTDSCLWKDESFCFCLPKSQDHVSDLCQKAAGKVHPVVFVQCYYWIEAATVCIEEKCFYATYWYFQKMNLSSQYFLYTTYNLQISLFLLFSKHYTACHGLFVKCCSIWHCYGPTLVENSEADFTQIEIVLAIKWE